LSERSRDGAIRWFGAGAIAMALAVGFGAFGAHGLRERVSADLLEVWQTGARYHAYHALGLLGVAWLRGRIGDDDARGVTVAGWLMLAGIVLFSGSLYALAATGIRTLGAITPFGGLSWIVAWCILGVVALRRRDTD